jgi:hypothetical protein
MFIIVGNCKWIELQAGKIASCQKGKLTKWQVDNIASLQKGKLSQWQAVKRAS